MSSAGINKSSHNLQATLTGFGSTNICHMRVEELFVVYCRIADEQSQVESSFDTYLGRYVDTPYIPRYMMMVI